VKPLFKSTLLLAAPLILGGCAQHLSKQQCLSMNWYQIGYADGNQGLNQRNLSQDIADCAKFKLKVNQSGYVQGWNAGVRQYCKPSNGYLLGTKGVTYNHICPKDLAGAFNNQWRSGLRKYCSPDTAFSLGKAGQSVPSFCSPMSNGTKFRNAYAAGQRLFNQVQSMQNHINDINNQINNLNIAISNKYRDIHSSEKALSQPNLPDSAKYALQQSINSAYNDITNMKTQIAQLQGQATYLQKKINLKENVNH